ncbi:phosphoprotein [Vesiculovirus morreton]|uniref:Phosphoprotein n=1 Tax=Vesiculovirus morreton TaxID=1972565 RepID=A0A0D3R1G8_9RHAB|nr:phosphoprotein [Vesiculovirus morreton]AEM60938.1 phosphoprotein [Vesicular stomatitis virus]AJR28461.1 phosphoprotein [Vesiculovirus morreton]
MDNLAKVREYLKTYSRLDQAVQEMDDLEAQREEKTNYELFQEEGIDIQNHPSYYQAAADESSDSEEEEMLEAYDVTEDQHKTISTDEVEGYIAEPSDDYADDEVNVVFTSDWKQPELESDGNGKTLRLTMPEGLSNEQQSQWLSTIKAVVQSAKYWNIAECTLESTKSGVVMKERQMTPDVYKVTPVLNNPSSIEETPTDVWSLCQVSVSFTPRKSGIQPFVISLEELFNSRAEFISVGGNGKMSHKEAILLGLRYKKLYNQARVKYNLG